MDGELKKGVLEMCILYLVSQGDQYGYEIIRLISAAFPDVLNSTVYAILRRLSTAGYILAYHGGTSSGPPRKYYKLTHEGRQHLQKTITDWHSLYTAINKIGVKGNIFYE